MALKNVGCDCADWENWSRADDRFKDGECESKWAGFKRNGLTIATIHDIAQQYGYSEKEFQREWYKQHGGVSKQRTVIPADNSDTAAQIDSLQADLRDVEEELAAFDKRRAEAIEFFKNVETFDSATVESEAVIEGAAFTYLIDDRLAYSDFKRDIQNWGNKHKDDKVNLTDWHATVKSKAMEVITQEKALRERQTAIKAKIDTLTFVGRNDWLKNFSPPENYKNAALSELRATILFLCVVVPLSLPAEFTTSAKASTRPR